MIFAMTEPQMWGVVLSVAILMVVFAFVEPRKRPGLGEWAAASSHRRHLASRRRLRRRWRVVQAERRRLMGMVRDEL